MSTLGLRLPVDIPWRRIGVSVHMMDPEICDKARPAVMQPSLAIFSYEPEDDQDIGDRAYKVSYLKITCSVTSFGATNLDKLRKGRRMVTSPFTIDFFGSSSYQVRKTNDFSSKQVLTGADLPCFGALLEVSVAPSSGDWGIQQYPYFSDFDPKKRELYELVSDTGEIMSRTLEKTGVLHGGTTSSSNEVFDKDTWGGSLKQSTGIGSKGDSTGQAEVSYKNEEGSRSVDSAAFTNVRQVDAGREERETYSHTTQLSQMYQLLMSAHLGTNRAVFFVEPRPHLVQRDRTLIDGPRQLEGIQEFFLVVVRPREMESICVSASLETLHVGAIIETPDPNEDPNKKTASLHFPRIGHDGGWPDPDESKAFTSEDSVTYTAPAGWVIDRFQGTDGYTVDSLDQAGGPIVSSKVDVTDKSVTIWARVKEEHIEGDWWDPTDLDKRVGGHFEMTITIYLKPEKPADPPTRQFAILTDTFVCTCPSLDRLKDIDRPSIVREIELPATDAPLGRPMPLDAARDWHRFFSQAVRSSFSSPDRYPRGTVDFWDLDVLKDALSSAVPQREAGRMSISRLLASGALAESGLDEETRAYLHRRDVSGQPMSALLRPSLHDFVAESGLTFTQATELRRSLWTSAASMPMAGTTATGMPAGNAGAGSPAGKPQRPRRSKNSSAD